jgi:hypothetical protein
MIRRENLVPKELGTRYTFEQYEIMNFNEITMVDLKNGFLFRNGTDYIDLKRSDNFHKGNPEVFEHDLLCLVAKYKFKCDNDTPEKTVRILENAFLLSVNNTSDCYTFDEIISYYQRIGKI